MMTSAVALLGIADSPLVDSLAGRLEKMGAAVWVLDLDAPLQGEPVTVRGDEVSWQGRPLQTAAVVWLEQPVFPWPQMLPPPCPLPDVENFNRWRTYQREAQALAVSALATVAEQVRFVNPPSSAHLAVAPVVILDRLTVAGLPVASWRVDSALDQDQGSPVVCDATGRDRWHPAGVLPTSAPRITWPDLGGEVVELLVIGGGIAGSRRWPDAAAWSRSEPDPADNAAPDLVTDLARRAATTLTLEMVQVTCHHDGSAAEVMLVDAAPDITTWDAQLDGAPVSALAHRLAVLAGIDEGDGP